ncbi:hypothetical protein C1H46_032714 [Malus baccata]|uniref:Uncharacterized protein n=1 Tax=Malus baccata TaxID=106549 RepID=A0A540L5P8_MALBA|nr:hypothetical protein C1H46_032714 [Malus baccata]
MDRISSAGLELANLLLTSPPLHQSWDAIQKQKLHTAADPNAQMALYISETKHSNTTIISFLTSPVKVQDPQAMISSTTLKDTNFLLFEFLCSKKTPSFSVNELTINFFALNHTNLDLLRTKVCTVISNNFFQFLSILLLLNQTFSSL